jgi:hypothetical protein
MCTHFLHLIHPPSPFLHHLPNPTHASILPWTELGLPSCSQIL